MAGSRPPGSLGLEPGPAPIDDGTSCRAASPPPGSTGVYQRWNAPPVPRTARAPSASLVNRASDSVGDLNTAIADFRRSERWSTLQPAAFHLLGQQSFGLGVVYGIGENVVGSVVELGLLAKTFLLADLYDRAHQPLLAAAIGPFGVLQRALAEVSMRAFGEELTEAYSEREALIAELRYTITHVGEVLENVRDSYVSTWHRFESLSQDRTLTSQFEAGRIFGEVLLEVLSLVGGGTAAIKAASKIPRLAKLAKLRIPLKPRLHVATGTAGAVAHEAPLTTPSRLRPVVSSTATRPPTPTRPVAPPPRPVGSPPDGPRVHSRYSDHTPVFEGQQPPRITGPHPDAGGPHTVLRHDPVNNRIYQGREFGGGPEPIP